MVILIGAIQHNTDDSENEHNSLPVFLPITELRYHVHEEQGWQEPGDTVQLTGNVGIELEQNSTYDGFDGIIYADTPLFDVELRQPVWIVNGII